MAVVDIFVIAMKLVIMVLTIVVVVAVMILTVVVVIVHSSGQARMITYSSTERDDCAIPHVLHCAAHKPLGRRGPNVGAL